MPGGVILATPRVKENKGVMIRFFNFYIIIEILCKMRYCNFLSVEDRIINFPIERRNTQVSSHNIIKDLLQYPNVLGKLWSDQMSSVPFCVFVIHFRGQLSNSAALLLAKFVVNLNFSAWWLNASCRNGSDSYHKRCSPKSCLLITYRQPPLPSTFFSFAEQTGVAWPLLQWPCTLFRYSPASTSRLFPSRIIPLW